ncbi:three-Cys-motif partner protein TcmP [Pedobacter nutrimenti]|uniref:three-Cys-motif partner protein TcmP n=1 Tax=Pedobacter nutrimenti TaxID=1241337 RepID=UPI00292E4F2F|nr:three-Cys-motif partner protein TcmP [Pedobacter nutrimenti]
MAAIDLHSKPFDEPTITKLEIFEDYTEAWLPTFIMQKRSVCIFDFFAGTGYDKNGVPGSPIRILNQIQQHRGNIFKNEVEIKLYLNEYDESKYNLLMIACRNFLDSFPGLEKIVKIEYSNEDFEKLFPKLAPEIHKSPSLVFLDQNGIKFTSEKYFLELEKSREADFLYFNSSSYFWRFGESPEFKMHLDINMDEAKKDYYKFIHVNIIAQIRNKLPPQTKLKLYPFSLKRGVNIHGIIFGASHPRAVDKFLDIAWKKNKSNGQANFDIDDEASINQINMFSGVRKSKIRSFQDGVKFRILNGDIKNNFELYDHVIAEGHVPSHAVECVKQMKKNGEVFYDNNSPLANYENVYKNKRKLDYRLK